MESRCEAGLVDIVLIWWTWWAQIVRIRFRFRLCDVYLEQNMHHLTIPEKTFVRIVCFARIQTYTLSESFDVL